MKGAGGVGRRSRGGDHQQQDHHHHEWKEREDELQLFKELHKREKDRAASLLQPISDEFDANGIHHSFYRLPSVKKDGSQTYDFFGAGTNGKSDYDWLKTPPATPLFPSLEMEATGAAGLVLQREITIVQPLSRFASTSDVPPIKSPTSSRPNIPTGGSSRPSPAQVQRSTPPPPLPTNVNITDADINVTNTTTILVTKNKVKTTVVAESEEEPTLPIPILSNQPQRKPSTDKQSRRDPTPPPLLSRPQSGDGSKGIGKSNKLLLQRSKRSSTKGAVASSDVDPLPRASSATRVRPQRTDHATKLTTINIPITSTTTAATTTTVVGKARTRQLVSATKNTSITIGNTSSGSTSTRQSSTKAANLYATSTSHSSGTSNKSSSKMGSISTSTSSGGTSTSTSISKQIFGSKMVDKVMSARKAASSGADQNNKAAAPGTSAVHNNTQKGKSSETTSSSSLGFGRMSALRNMELKRDRVMNSRHNPARS